jgi:HK97 family phage major capsid protein
MKNQSLKEVRQQIADLKAEGNALLQKAELTEADLKRDDEILAQVKELGALEKRLEAHADWERALPSEKSVREPGADDVAHARNLVVTDERDRALDRYLGGADAAVINAAKWRQTIAALNKPSGPWNSFGDFLITVSNAARPGGRVDPRLMMFEATASGANEMVPSDGGFLVRRDYSDILLDRALETSMLAQRCYRQPIGPDSDGIELPFIDETSRATGQRWGGVQVYRRAEADTVNATRPKIGRMEIRLEDMMAIAYATDRLLKDAAAIGAFFTKAFTSEFAFKLDDEVVRGTGAGQCLGMLKAPALITVNKESGQAAASLVFQNILKMHSRLKPGSMGLSAWFVNNEVLPAIWGMDFPVGTGGAPAFMPPGGLSASPYMSILGRPVIPIEQAEALGTVGDIILADLSDYMLIDKGGIDAAQSMHVRFIYGENTFRWVYRVNGQPMTRVAVTPYKGSASLSPYVALQTRS